MWFQRDKILIKQKKTTARDVREFNGLIKFGLPAL